MSPPANKYRNVPTIVDGIRFASKKEAKRWGELRLLEQAGEIRYLQRQVRYPLVVREQHIGDYICDFSYSDRGDGKRCGGTLVIEDCKGVKTPVYRLKKKLMKAIHGIEIKES